MTFIQVIIKKTSEDKYEFSYSTDKLSLELHEERAAVVRFIDEAVDSLMRLTNKLTCTKTDFIPVYQNTLIAGEDSDRD